MYNIHTFSDMYIHIMYINNIHRHTSHTHSLTHVEMYIINLHTVTHMKIDMLRSVDGCLHKLGQQSPTLK